MDRRWSSYNYGHNNPISHIDVDGMFDWVEIDDGKRKSYTYDKDIHSDAQAKKTYGANASDVTQGGKDFVYKGDDGSSTALHGNGKWDQTFQTSDNPGGITNSGIAAGIREMSPMLDMAYGVAVGTSMFAMPGGEVSLGSGIAKDVVSLDNNALIAAIEGGGKAEVQAAIGGATPIVSRTAAKEFLMKGDINALRAFMKETGATIGNNGASSSLIENLQNSARQLGRSLGTNDASIIGSAMNNGAKVITNDKRMINFMNAVGLPVTGY